MTLQSCLSTLERHAHDADDAPSWPEASWRALAESGVLAWSITRTHGGSARDALDLLHGYEQLAGACLTTCFLLSQREAAVRRIDDLGNDELKQTLLPHLADGSRFATVGLSQLTTSRQHQAPAVTARAEGEAFVLNGIVPWVTGAARADHILLGAVTDAGQQVLVVVPGCLPGVSVSPPLDLMALRGSMTAEVRLHEVLVERRWLLAGPAERVLGTSRGGPGGLETSCLALGLAGAAIDYLTAEAAQRPELSESVNNLEQERRGVRTEMHALVAGSTPDRAIALRTRANSLVLRSTQAALMTSKGTGFLRQHPAQRWARQALFFLVWSCPRPTAQATLAQLAPPTSNECSA